MIKYFLKVVLFVLLAILVAYAVDYISGKLLDEKPISNTGTYQVVSVFDGDTIEVDMAGKIEKIRFIGVDTPETGGHDTQIECYGPEASQFTQNLLEGKRVELLADSTTNNRDLYDRLLRYVVRADDNLDVNLELIKQGYSDAYLVFPHGRRSEFASAASVAKSSGVGLWSACQTAEN